MKVGIDESFKNSLEDLVKKDKKAQHEIRKIIDEIVLKIQRAGSIHDLHKFGLNVLKLRQTGKNISMFRIRKGRYRIGIKLQEDTIILLWIKRRDERTYS